MTLTRVVCIKHERPCGQIRAPASQDKPAEVFVVDDGVQSFADISLVDLDVSHLHVGSFEAEFFQQSFQDGVQPPRADILRRLVDLVGVVGECFDCGIC